MTATVHSYKIPTTYWRTTINHAGRIPAICRDLRSQHQSSKCSKVLLYIILIRQSFLSKKQLFRLCQRSSPMPWYPMASASFIVILSPTALSWTCWDPVFQSFAAGGTEQGTLPSVSNDNKQQQICKPVTCYSSTIATWKFLRSCSQYRF